MGIQRTGVALLCAALTSGGLIDLHAAVQLGAKVPRSIKNVTPVYPAASLAAGDEGMVIVELNVSASGLVSDARVIWSTCRALNDAALTAVRSWVFERVFVNGEAMAFDLTTQLPFRLPERLQSRAGRPGSCRWVNPPAPIR